MVKINIFQPREFTARIHPVNPGTGVWGLEKNGIMPTVSQKHIKNCPLKLFLPL